MNEKLRYSLEYIQSFNDVIPGINNFPSRIMFQNIEDFTHILYKDLDSIIRDISENPELRRNDSEDRLTIEIITNLRRYGYFASHDEKIGGHADLSVKWKDWLWIGEAKIHSSYDYLYQGFQQLSTRYSIGSSYQKYGGLLIYVRVRDMANVVKKWKSHLISKRENLKIDDCKISPECFISVHKHDKSGQDFYVRHMPISLFFDPQDHKKK